MSLTDSGVEVFFGIDETKITIITRAQRLSRVAIEHLTPLRDTALDTAQLDEVLAWLKEMET